MSPDQIRSTALKHLNCKVFIDVFSDNSVCLVCEDHDVIISNFGDCCLFDVMRSASPSSEDTCLISDFNQKYYEEIDDNDQPDEGDPDSEPRRAAQPAE